MISELYEDVTGQDRSVGVLRSSAPRPVHAYLLVGPPGTGKRATATSFAASLLCPTSGEHDRGLCEVCRRVIAGVHPDIVHVEREGAAISIDAAREVTRLAFMSPVESPRKVVVLHDFHLVQDTGPALLKTIEEPPASTVFVVLAEYIPPELRTIASRCMTVEFPPLTERQVVAALVDEGVGAERASQLAEAAGGRLDRARLLAADAGFEARRQTWHLIPTRIDSSGATAAAIADELVGLLDSSVDALRTRQTAEMEALAKRNEDIAVQSGGRARANKAMAGVGVKEMEERHRREVRRQRTDELRAGLSALAGAYRERLATATDPRRRAEAIESIRHVDTASRNLEFNPGELLALQALLARLGRIDGATAARR